MTDAFDRDPDDDGGTGFLVGLVTGAVIGAGLALLFAPRAGSALRAQLSTRAGHLAEQAQKGYQQAAAGAGQWVEKTKHAPGEWADRSKNLAGKARDAFARAAEEGEKSVRDGGPSPS